jgi:hypothetical protein
MDVGTKELLFEGQSGGKLKKIVKKISDVYCS